jgi:hypothetical protein
MTIKQVKNIIDFLANKYQLGYLSGEEFNNAFYQAEVAQMSFLIGNLHQFTPGRPIPRIGLNMTKGITERLSPFRFTVPVSTGTTGEISKMSDVAAVEAMNKADGTRVKYVSPNYLSSHFDNPVWDLATQPIYTEYDTYFKVYPISPSMDVIITAIRKPPYSKWAYDVVDDVEVYNNIASTDPLWKDVDIVDIIGRMCKNIGISLKDGELTNYGQSIINQGE